MNKSSRLLCLALLSLVFSCGESNVPQRKEAIVASWSGSTVIEGNEQNQEPDLNVKLDITFGSNGTGSFTSSYDNGDDASGVHSYNADFDFVVTDETFIMNYELTVTVPCDPGVSECDGKETREESLTSGFVVDENELTIDNWQVIFVEDDPGGDLFTSITLERVN